MTANTPGEPAPALTPNQSPPGAAPTLQTGPAVPRDRVRDLHPGWFASVMGTAILAVATYLNPGNLTTLRGAAHGLGAGLAVLAYALGAVMTLVYAVRWIRHRGAAMADLHHPVLGAMHATLPGGLLVLAVMTSVVGPELLPAGAVTALIAVLAAVGSVLAVVISVAFAMTLFVGAPPAASVNGGWFIPPVVTIIIPMALTPLVPHVGPGNARLLLALGYAAYGMGFLLFLLVLGLAPRPSRAAPSAARAARAVAVDRLGTGRRSGTRAFGPGSSRPGPLRRRGTQRDGPQPAVRHGCVGLRAVVARHRRDLAGALPACRPPAVPPGLVGLHLPPRRLHRGNSDLGPHLASPGSRGCRCAPVPDAGRVLGRRDRQDPHRDPHRRIWQR